MLTEALALIGGWRIQAWANRGGRPIARALNRPP